MAKQEKNEITAAEAKERAKAAMAKKKKAQAAEAEEAEEAEESEDEEETVDEEVETTSSKKKSTSKKKPTAKEKKSVKGLRIAAVILWVLALAAEVGAFFALHYVLLNNAEFGSIEVWYLIGALVIDAVLCVTGSLLWKKSNKIKPCLADSKLVRTLWHQLGVIMVLVCLLPIGIVLLVKSKNMSKKLRTILLIIMLVLFAGATALSVDYNQPSEEEVAQLQEEAIAENPDGEVYWTRFGKSYHFDLDCQALKNAKEENIFSGSIDEAFEANRWDPCDFCAGGADENTEE